MKYTYLTSLIFALLSSAALPEDIQITIEAGGKPALQLTVPADAKITTKGEKTFIQSNSVAVYLWHLPKAKSVADAAAQAVDIIKSEFLGLNDGETKNI